MGGVELQGVLQLLSDPSIAHGFDTARDAALTKLAAWLTERGLNGASRVAARVLKRRLDGAGDEETRVALLRMASFGERLDSRITRLEKEGRLIRADLEQQYNKPEVTAALYQAFDEAVESDDVLRQVTLADVVAERLMAADESLQAIATRNAIKAMSSLNAEHLKALALIAFINVRLEAALEDDYVAQLNRFGNPLIEIPTTYETLAHLQSLGLISIDSGSDAWEHLGTPAILSQAAMAYPLLAETNPIITKLMDRAHGNDKGSYRLRPGEAHTPLQLVNITPVGMILASAVLRSVCNLDLRS